jgi:MtN3 and saliva related transmembrane protein
MIDSLVASIADYFQNTDTDIIINTFISTTAITLSAIALVPQIYQICTTRSARDVSFSMLAMLLTVSVMQLCYGILTGQNGLPLIITNSISISLRLMVLVCKVYMDRNTPVKKQ